MTFSSESSWRRLTAATRDARLAPIDHDGYITVMRVNSEKAMIRAIALRRSANKSWDELVREARDRDPGDPLTARTASEFAGA